MCVLRFGKEQQRFDTRNVSVQVGYGLFVFKIGYGTYSPQDCRNVSFLSFDNCQVVVGDDFDPGFVGKQFPQHIHSLVGGIKASFRIVDTDGDDDFVEDLQSPTSNRCMPEGERIECPRIKGYFSEVFIVNNQIIDNKILPFHRVFTHVEFE